jgi:SAM-dependent methyltransferase
LTGPLGILETLLARPSFYDMAQVLLGATEGRRHLIRNFVRPRLGIRVLDIGCGTARILEELPHATEYWGYDVSEKYVAAAKSKYGDRGRFSCRELDESELERLPKFDIVLATGLLHHLDDRQADNFLQLARRALASGGRLISIDPCLVEGQNPLARLLIKRDRGQHVRGPDGYRSLAARAFSSVRGAVRHRAWVPYTHWIMECEA